jgi:hypothetical protein
MTRVAIVAATLLSLFALPQHADAQGSEALVGAWKITSWSRKDISTGNVEHAMGTKPSGLVVYTKGGIVSAFVSAEDRRAKGTAPMTDEDRVALFTTMYAYSGTYSVEGRKLTTRIENSWNKAWNGNILTSEFEVSGNTLTVTSAPTAAAKDGKQVVFVHTFEKAE